MSPNEAKTAGFKACQVGTPRENAPEWMRGDILLAWRRGWDYYNRGTL